MSTTEQKRETYDITRSGRDLTTSSIPRLIVKFAMPMIAGGLLQTAYSFVNTFWVGKFLGTNALAVVTVSMPPLFVTFAMAAGLTLAANILIAQYFGARNWERLRSVVQTSVALVSGISLGLLVLGLLASKHLLELINTPYEILPAAITYLRIMMLGLPFAFWIFLIGSMLRGVGDSTTPVYFQLVSVLLNALLDPLLMFGWLGFPRLGLNGTAWATLIAQIVAVFSLLVYIPRRRQIVSPQLRGLRVDGPTTRMLVKIGLPAMLQQSVVSVSMVVIVGLVSVFGARTDAAFGAALRIDQVAFLPAITMGVAVSSLAGQNIGAGHFLRVREVFRWGLLLSGGISLVISVAAISMPQLLLRIFVNEIDVIAIGSQYLRIVGITYVLYSVLFVSNGIINGAGHTFTTTVISMIALWGIRLPLAAFLSHYLREPVGIWYAMLSSVAAGMMLSLAYYFSGRWRRSVVQTKTPVPA